MLMTKGTAEQFLFLYFRPEFLQYSKIILKKRKKYVIINGGAVNISPHKNAFASKHFYARYNKREK